MKKSARVLLALVALFGMANCLAAGPALVAQEETACMTADGCDDCFVCCAFNHPAIPSVTTPFSPGHKISPLIEAASVSRFDSPSFSIFHPPVTV